MYCEVFFITVQGKYSCRIRPFLSFDVQETLGRISLLVTAPKHITNHTCQVDRHLLSVTVIYRD